jgi:hypothetical protein
MCIALAHGVIYIKLFGIMYAIITIFHRILIRVMPIVDNYVEKSFITLGTNHVGSKPGLLRTNSLAYFNLPSVTKKKVCNVINT